MNNEKRKACKYISLHRKLLLRIFSNCNLIECKKLHVKYYVNFN